MFLKLETERPKYWESNNNNLKNIFYELEQLTSLVVVVLEDRFKTGRFHFLKCHRHWYLPIESMDLYLIINIFLLYDYLLPYKLE
jgi:hypothetical protein